MTRQVSLISNILKMKLRVTLGEKYNWLQPCLRRNGVKGTLYPLLYYLIHVLLMDMEGHPLVPACAGWRSSCLLLPSTWRTEPQLSPVSANSLIHQHIWLSAAPPRSTATFVRRNRCTFGLCIPHWVVRESQPTWASCEAYHLCHFMSMYIICTSHGRLTLGVDHHLSSPYFQDLE